ncbi:MULTISPECIES: hypothetical protein [unclassified Xanthobacter]|uniref:hypothetical protein n=1 Tax=unclassified Xanthobacter TaxID=2623496 RepID=UPI001F3B845F|nr:MULTISPECIES: hypothetical protein [unclassified Xanthobacter]
MVKSLPTIWAFLDITSALVGLTSLVAQFWPPLVAGAAAGAAWALLTAIHLGMAPSSDAMLGLSILVTTTLITVVRRTACLFDRGPAMSDPLRAGRSKRPGGPFSGSSALAAATLLAALPIGLSISRMLPLYLLVPLGVVTGGVVMALNIMVHDAGERPAARK